MMRNKLRESVARFYFVNELFGKVFVGLVDGPDE
jgi:hypothetical protein